MRDALRPSAAALFANRRREYDDRRREHDDLRQAALAEAMKPHVTPFRANYFGTEALIVSRAPV
jgi:hypothetical protein